MSNIGAKEFKKINWLPTKERVEQRIVTKFLITGRGLPHELFVPSRNTYNAKWHMALEIPLNKSNSGQKSISFIGSSISNSLTNNSKVLNTITSFTHNCQKLVLQPWSEYDSILIITFNHCYYYQKNILRFFLYVNDYAHTLT